MAKKPNKHSTGCPIAYGLDNFGDRWSLLIIRDLMLHGKKTYSEFLASDENIATNILITRLRHLEAEGIVSKAKDPQNRRSNTYSLTEKGRDLAPVMMEIIRWSGIHDTKPEAKKDVFEALLLDPERFEKNLRRST
jgi:DNA-binding HxlR family transcriptional regulator